MCLPGKEVIHLSRGMEVLVVFEATGLLSSREVQEKLRTSRSWGSYLFALLNKYI